MEHQNGGMITLGCEPALTGGASKPRTLVVSGVARSGTSMVARVLNGAGLFLGETFDEIVFEDHAFALMFENNNIDHAALDRLVARRNARHRIWGFKRPHLHIQGAGVIATLRNPRVILTVRDPVAIAERNAIAEQREAAIGLAEAVADLKGMIDFAGTLSCPVLLVSYEKALQNPDRFIQHLLEFCGLRVPAAQRDSLRALIEPGRPAYVQQARRQFDGYIDAIRGNRLMGWAWQKNLPLPTTLTLFRDDTPVQDVVADRHRADLQHNGIGNGNHGFEIDLAGLGFQPESRVTVRVAGRRFALNRSGLAVSALIEADMPLLAD